MHSNSIYFLIACLTVSFCNALPTMKSFSHQVATPLTATSRATGTISPITTTISPTTSSTTVNATAKAAARLSRAQSEELRRKLAAAGGCNANICFAIDGSSAIPSEDFEAQKNFVLDMASIIGVDEPVEMAAVQYSTATSRVSPLTVDSASFVRAVSQTWQRKGGSFVTGGINYCFAQLYRRPFEANKIVVLGDGRQTIGSSAVRRAQLFRSIGGRVAVVSAGKPDHETLLKIAGGNFDVVYEVNNFLNALAMKQLITELVGEVCLSN